MMNWCRCFSPIACLLFATSVAQPQAAPLGPGTYELAWYAQDVAAPASIRAHIILVLMQRPIPDSVWRQIGPRILGDLPDPTRQRYLQTAPIPPTDRACWRLIDGSIPMGGGGPTISRWDTLPGGAADLTLWWSVDAGTRLRLWTDAAGLRGEAESSGYRGSPVTYTVTRDSLRGRRVGDPDPTRCLSGR